jgi:hypothetical protein
VNCVSPESETLMHSRRLRALSVCVAIPLKGFAKHRNTQHRVAVFRPKHFRNKPETLRNSRCADVAGCSVCRHPKVDETNLTLAHERGTPGALDLDAEGSES